MTVSRQSFLSVTSRIAAIGTLFVLLGAARPADAEVPAEYQTAVERAVALGAALYVHDFAAARATDELARHDVLKKDKRVRGWITTQSADSIAVTFFGEENGISQALYRVRVPSVEGPLGYEALKPAQMLTEVERASVAARTLALAEYAAHGPHCSGSLNTVVLPGSPHGEPHILVYVLAATDEPGVVVAGGHMLFQVSADGKRIEEQRTFTKSCLEIPPDEPKIDQNVAAMIMTHLLDPTPTEIHVFLSRLHRKPLYIMTPGSQLLWVVDGLKIDVLDQSKQSP